MVSGIDTRLSLSGKPEEVKMNKIRKSKQVPKMMKRGECIAVMYYMPTDIHKEVSHMAGVMNRTIQAQLDVLLRSQLRVAAKGIMLEVENGK